MRNVRLSVVNLTNHPVTVSRATAEIYPYVHCCFRTRNTLNSNRTTTSPFTDHFIHLWHGRQRMPKLNTLKVGRGKSFLRPKGGRMSDGADGRDVDKYIPNQQFSEWDPNCEIRTTKMICMVAKFQTTKLILHVLSHGWTSPRANCLSHLCLKRGGKLLPLTQLLMGRGKPLGDCGKLGWHYWPACCKGCVSIVFNLSLLFMKLRHFNVRWFA